jgi:hypothetical protein
MEDSSVINASERDAPTSSRPTTRRSLHLSVVGGVCDGAGRQRSHHHIHHTILPCPSLSCSHRSHTGPGLQKDAHSLTHSFTHSLTHSYHEITIRLPSDSTLSSTTDDATHEAVETILLVIVIVISIFPFDCYRTTTTTIPQIVGEWCRTCQEYQGRQSILGTYPCGP